MGVDCDFGVIDDDNREEFILDRMEQHAHEVHTEIAANIPDIRGELRKQLRSLARQSYYGKDNPEA